MKIIKFIIKRLIMSAFVLYLFNYLSSSFSFIIPINVFNLSILSILGLPGFISLIIFKIII